MQLLLDCLHEGVFVIDEDLRIKLCNLSLLSSLKYIECNILTMPVWRIISPPSMARFAEHLAKSDEAASTTSALPDFELLDSDSSSFMVNMVAQKVFLGGKWLNVFLCSASEPTGKLQRYSLPGNNIPITITELHKAQYHLRILNKSLDDQTDGKRVTVDLLNSRLNSIADSLENLRNSLLLPNEDFNLNDLAVAVMNLALRFWIESTGNDKFTLARSSGLWNVYTNADGWERTQTLDKYLEHSKFPSKPKWEKIIATVEFVLKNGKTDSLLRTTLEKTFLKFRAYLSASTQSL